MPQFEMPFDGPDDWAAFCKLDSFTQGYVEAIFWLEAADGNDCEGCTLADLAPDSLEKIIAECRDFQASLPKDSHGRTYLDLAYDYAPNGYDEHQAGVDFWLTRNGHGAGFWDHGLGEIGDRLSAAAKACGVQYVYKGDDEKMHVA